MRFLSLLAMLFLAGCGCCAGMGEIQRAFAREAERAEYQEQVAAEREAATKALPEFERAWREQDFAKVADLANGVARAFESDNYHDAPRAWFYVRVATACERIGAIDRAIDYWNSVADEACDPDAEQAWTRLMVQAGRRANGAPDLEELKQRVLDGDAGDPGPKAKHWLVLGDRWLGEGGKKQAAMCYRYGTENARQGDRPALVTSGLLREARALAADELFEVAARKLQQIERLPVPPALDFATQLAAVQEAVAADRRVRVAKALGDFTFPEDVDLASALAGAKGVTIARNGAVATIRCVGGSAVTVRAEVARPAGTFDPWRRCMVLHDVATAPDVALLFANGDLFVGSDALIGSGLYLSAERPATIGPCRFGIPLERATVPTEVVQQTEQRDGDWLVVATYSDGSSWIGTAVRDGGRLIPHGYGLLIRPDSGYFVGQMQDGQPEEGGYLTNDGNSELYSAGALVEKVVGTGRFENARTELKCEAGDCIEYFDRRNGTTLEFDRVTYFKSKIDLDRLAQNRDREDAARRFQEARLASEARQPTAAEESDPARSLEYYQQLYGCCARCDGSGSVYVWGTVKEVMVWSYELNTGGSWVNKNLVTSGSVEACASCNGTGVSLH